MTAGGVRFHRIDAAVGAMVHADWPWFERRLTEGVAALARAEFESLTVDQQEIEAAATAFRYERDLISGDEVTAWLDRAGFGVAEWQTHLVRTLMRKRYAGDLDGTVDRHPPSAQQLRETALVEGICSGQFAAFETALARRVAVALDADAAAVTAQDFPPDLVNEASKLARRHPHWFEGDATDQVVERIARGLRIERAFAAAADRLATDDALRATVETHRMEWTRLTVQLVSFSTEDAAREAILCATVDRLALDEIGWLARQPVRHESVFVDDLPEPRRVALLTADIGLTIGPLAAGDRFDVAIVTDHAAPSLDDDGVRHRARHAVVEAAADRLVRERIRGVAGG